MSSTAVLIRSTNSSAPLQPAVAAEDVSLAAAGAVLLRNVTVAVSPGELVAIAGPSGAGKTTLLRVLAGQLAPTAGRVLHATDPPDGKEPGPIGYVPQDDIVPRDMSVEAVLRSAADLVVAESGEARQARVDRSISAMGLGHRRRARVRSLSGGERKRVNVAIELLTEPPLLLLDEPTAGLDPSTAATLLGNLHDLVAQGSAVVLTTHAADDILRTDRVVLMASGGHVAFDGTPDAASRHFDVERLVDVYPILSVSRPAPDDAPPPPDRRGPRRRGRGATAATTARQQWWTFTRRNAAQLRANLLTLAIVAGSPALVTAMMATLFPQDAVGGFDGGRLGAQVAYWLSFSAFFFGLTYGLLQIAPEIAVLRRDVGRGARVGAYLLAKMTVLLPLLAIANVGMLAILRATDRLPDLASSSWMALLVAMSAVSFAALATGLLASAAVRDTTQATLALPMICFPQVLFAGLLIPRPDMTLIGQRMSDVLATRWGFGAIGAGLRLDALLDADTAGYRTAFAESAAHGCVVLLVIGVVLTAATVAVLRRRCDAA